MFSIHDSKGEIFNPPFFKSTHGEAERDFQTASQDDQSMISKYPEDFDLYYLGEYDDQTGKFKALPTPQHIIKAVNVLQRATNVRSIDEPAKS